MWKPFIAISTDLHKKKTDASLGYIHDQDSKPGIIIIIIIIIITIIFIYCNWVVTRWQWLFYMYTKYEIGYY